MPSTTASRETIMARHAALDNKIQLEQARPGSNDWFVKALKRQKLYLKEQLEGMN